MITISIIILVLILVLCIPVALLYAAGDVLIIFLELVGLFILSPFLLVLWIILWLLDLVLRGVDWIVNKCSK